MQEVRAETFRNILSLSLDVETSSRQRQEQEAGADREADKSHRLDAGAAPDSLRDAAHVARQPEIE